ncbi:MAG: deoxyguanosinetriphosphate triphosphohydrolase [Desulfobacterales bacterium]|nr:deoxyguanosinetriphosphate triphosphohydrolase [Desulfobacterales bacterium]
MTIREDFENREKNFIAPYGCLSAESRGRTKKEAPCPVRTEFQRDRDRIVYSNAFRRLKHKTQVFLSPLGDHYRTRLTHTLEVSEIARSIARALRLNEDLVEAIALAHDIGHTPFGHGGETVLKEIYSNKFSHHAQGLRVVEFLERKGMGLNLTMEVRDGIIKHSKGYGNIIPENPKEQAITIEGRVVRVADIMAYLNHDLDDAIRSRVITRSEVPESCTSVLGSNHSDRATTMIKDIIYSSEPDNNDFKLKMSDEIFNAMTDLRQFLYDKVYRSRQVHKEFIKAKKVLSELFEYFLNNQDVFKEKLVVMEMSECYRKRHSNERMVCDFIASMTDRFALNLYSEIFMPTPLV